MGSLREVAERAQNCSAGLQIFLDNIRLRDTGIRESVHEFMLLDKGFLQLHAALSLTPATTPALHDDIALLMESMTLTMNRVARMFGETKNRKLDGKRPFQYVWTELCKDFDQNEGGVNLPSRLQLYSMFLTQILLFLQGYNSSLNHTMCLLIIVQSRGGPIYSEKTTRYDQETPIIPVTSLTSP